MTVTPEQIAAYADGELDEVTAARVARAIADSPELAAQLAAHQALREQLSAHFAPILSEPVPEGISAPIAATFEPAAMNAVSNPAVFNTRASPCPPRSFVRKLSVL